MPINVNVTITQTEEEIWAQTAFVKKSAIGLLGSSA